MSEEKKDEIIDVAEEIQEEVEEKVKEAQEGVESGAKKCFDMLNKITDKVREFVLGFGELIITVTVIIGLVSAVINGLATMYNTGFFTGLTQMFNNAVSVVMGALILFLLFAIHNSLKKD